MPGWWRSNSSLIDSLHMAPDETMSTRELRSQCPGRAISASSRGREKGSPTMTRAFTFSRSTVSSSSTGSYRRLASSDDPPALGQAEVGGEPAGAVHERAGRQQGGGAVVGHRAIARTASIPPSTGYWRDAAVDEAGEEVVLAPHDALGHAGGAAGVDHEEVVAAAAPRGGDAAGWPTWPLSS